MIPPEIIDKANVESEWTMRPEIYQAGKGMVPWRQSGNHPGDYPQSHLLCFKSLDRFVVLRFNWVPSEQFWHNGSYLFNFGDPAVYAWCPLSEIPLPEWVKK